MVCPCKDGYHPYLDPFVRVHTHILKDPTTQTDIGFKYLAHSALTAVWGMGTWKAEFPLCFSGLQYQEGDWKGPKEASQRKNKHGQLASRAEVQTLKEKKNAPKQNPCEKTSQGMRFLPTPARCTASRSEGRCLRGLHNDEFKDS